MKQGPKDAGQEPAWLGVVRNKIDSLRFGVVQIVVHESRVIQIESTEKLRFDKPEREPSASPHPKTQNLGRIKTEL